VAHLESVYKPVKPGFYLRVFGKRDELRKPFKTVHAGYFWEQKTVHDGTPYRHRFGQRIREILRAALVYSSFAETCSKVIRLPLLVESTMIHLHQTQRQLKATGPLRNRRKRTLLTRQTPRQHPRLPSLAASSCSSTRRDAHLCSCSMHSQP